MNSSAAAPSINSTGNGPDSGNVKGFSYGIAFAVIILIVMSAISLVAYCTRWVTPLGSSRSRRRALMVADQQDEAGLAQATIDSYPKLTYAEAKKTTPAADECCSICLSDYRDDDALRQLPECGHLFHLGCIDPWLRRHLTCPVCRSFSVNTPSAEFV
ncbi:putative RING-H2 finger protein ATL71 [Platanthera zijinensis]|uniref:RING-type E3 ubiquitin transferase n=1 Tax=Platanthera zijinensis TaxID=2320716 RepID=A0AAP0C1T4_9ASPA